MMCAAAVRAQTPVMPSASGVDGMIGVPLLGSRTPACPAVLYQKPECRQLNTFHVCLRFNARGDEHGTICLTLPGPTNERDAPVAFESRFVNNRFHCDSN